MSLGNIKHHVKSVVPILGGRRGSLRSFTNIPRDSDFGLGHLGTSKRFPGNESRLQG